MKRLWLVFGIGIMLVGCKPEWGDRSVAPTPVVTPILSISETQDEDVVRELAHVEIVEVLFLESFPLQVNLVVRGYVPDGCTDIGEISIVQEERVFKVVIPPVRPRGAVCTQAIRSFEQSVSLDVYGLLAGSYTVEVNGVTETFRLEQDNLPQEGSL